MEQRVAFFESENKLIEAQRVKQRTMYDIEMMQELGYCSGIVWPSTGRTSITGSSRPVGRMTCSTICPDLGTRSTASARSTWSPAPPSGG